MKISAFILSVLLTFISLLPLSHANPVCSDELESLPILSGGRIKPLRVHAKETLKFITGKSKWEGNSSTVTYCQQSLSFLNTESDQTIFTLPIRINHVENRKLLGISEDQKLLAFATAEEKLPQMEQALRALKQSSDSTPQSKDLQAVILRTQLTRDILAGNNWKVPVLHPVSDASKPSETWISLKKMIQFSGLQNPTPQSALRQAQDFGKQFTARSGSKHQRELTYEKLQLFHWAILATLLTLVFTIVFSRATHPITLSALSLALLIQIAGMVFRISISARSPVTNMYESVMWVGLGGLAFASFLTYWNREKIYLQVGLVLNIACLFMMTFANGMLDPRIKPLVPVLRDNFWLSTHVTTITISYAVLALSWILANYYMLRSIWRPVPAEFTRRMNKLCYQCLKYGVVLLSLGIILGGVWADYSWGRFWGWDPKETWSLITLMIYIAILHGRFNGWVTPKRFLPLVALAFLSVLMTWFGVNYILAVGLHSYGFSEGGSLFLFSIFLTQTAILVAYLFRSWTSQRSLLSNH